MATDLPRPAIGTVVAAALLLAGPASGQQAVGPGGGGFVGGAGAGADQEVPAQEDEREGGSTLVPLPVVFYQPETGLGFGVAANYYTRFTEAPPDQPDVTVPPSVFQLIAVYTVKSQIITTLKSELYLGGTRYRVLGDMGYSRFPTKFWGIGNDTPEEAEEDYTPERLTVLGIDAQRELMRGWYLGVTARAFYRKISEVETDGLLATGDVPGSDDGWSLGVGVVGTRDTRDLTTFPTSGSFHQLRALVYSSVWGSDFEYGTYLLDLRRYLPLGRRKTVAIRGLAWASSGTPPFDQLPQIGGDQLLRGYFQGRFTDRQLVAAQAEYRGPAFWRIGWVAFGGVGQVADTWGGFEADGFKTTVGAGIRFLISDRESLFIRADLGYGVDTGSTGFYLNIGEAF